ncbi:MAG: SDR family oxidoreductase [Actinobacteria bacterium]|nr:SDR family oxidoreductase [Actinomycetota bacterium]
MTDKQGRLEGAVVAVTGGGSGIGRAGAVACAAAGARLLVTDIDAGRAEAVAASIREAGGEAASLAVDVTDRARVAAMVEAAVERWGSLDGLFHCAVDVAFVNNRDARLTELDDEVWERMIDLVLTGTYNCCKLVGRQMIAQGSGSIVLTATDDALIGCAGLDAYTAAKGGVVALTRSFAAGIARDGVRVNSICPSFVSSEPQRAWLDDDASRRAVDALHLLPIPAPEEIAPLVVYLLADESRAMTGTVVPIDSGYMAFKANLDIVGAMRVGD